MPAVACPATTPGDAIRIVPTIFAFSQRFAARMPTIQFSPEEPERIPIGEVRGAEALDLLKAWGTGHPGGIGTIHAGTALGALRRLEQLIQEAVVTVPRALIAETIDLVAVLSGRGSTRRLAELARVEGLTAEGDYCITPATPPLTGDPS